VAQRLKTICSDYYSSDIAKRDFSLLPFPSQIVVNSCTGCKKLDLCFVRLRNIFSSFCFINSKNAGEL